MSKLRGWSIYAWVALPNSGVSWLRASRASHQKKCAYAFSAHIVSGGTCARRRDAAHGALVLRLSYAD